MWDILEGLMALSCCASIFLAPMSISIWSTRRRRARIIAQQDRDFERRMKKWERDGKL